MKRPEVPTFIAAYPVPGSNRSLLIGLGIVLIIAIVGGLIYHYVKKNSSTQDNGHG